MVGLGKGPRTGGSRECGHPFHIVPINGPDNNIFATLLRICIEHRLRTDFFHWDSFFFLFLSFLIYLISVLVMFIRAWELEWNKWHNSNTRSNMCVYLDDLWIVIGKRWVKFEGRVDEAFIRFQSRWFKCICVILKYYHTFYYGGILWCLKLVDQVTPGKSPCV